MQDRWCDLSRFDYVINGTAHNAWCPRQQREVAIVVGEAAVLAKLRSAGVLDDLLARGHLAEMGPDWSEGRLSAARLEGGQMFAGANPRGMQGYAAGR